jgi:SOS-response transcriptional repressor LexA
MRSVTSGPLKRGTKSGGGHPGAIADAPRDELGRAPLTVRQREVLEFIRDCIAEHGWPPTFREIASAFGLVSPHGAMTHVRALERRGWIQRGPGARQIRIVTAMTPTVAHGQAEGGDA